MNKQRFLSICAGLASFVFLDVLYDISHIKVQRYHIKSKKIKTPYHFVVLADLHDNTFGKDNERLLQKIDEIAPEAVYIAGDMITAHPKENFDSTLAFLEKLSKKYPVYYGSGNHEYRMRIDTDKYGDMSEKYEEKLRQMGIVRLYTGSCETHRKDVRVAGLEIESMYYKKWKIQHMPRRYSVEKLGMADEDCFTILLAHNPEYFPNYARTGADLVLAGHLHGGIAKLPFIGGVISPRFRLFPQYSGGLYKKGKSRMIVSRGLGCHTIPVRFLNPCELVDVMVVPPKNFHHS